MFLPFGCIALIVNINSFLMFPRPLFEAVTGQEEVFSILPESHSFPALQLNETLGQSVHYCAEQRVCIMCGLHTKVPFISLLSAGLLISTLLD